MGTGVSRAPKRRSSGGGSGGTTAMLSIFLLLLAFFLMLNSLARFETTRTRAVLGSLNATFNVANPEGREHEFGSFVGKVGAAERLHTEAGILLRTMFGIDRFELVRAGNVIVIDLDARTVFPDGAKASPSFLVFSTRLASAALPPPAGVEILTEVTVHRGTGRISRADPATLDLMTRRAGSLVRAFERTGFDAHGMTTAVAEGDPRRVRITFRVIDTPFSTLSVDE